MRVRQLTNREQQLLQRGLNRLREDEWPGAAALYGQLHLSDGRRLLLVDTRAMDPIEGVDDDAEIWTPRDADKGFR